MLPAGFQKLSTTAETFAAYTHDPTGFVDPANVVTNYDIANRTLTLSHPSGFVTFIIFGVEYSYASPWIVPTVLGGATPLAHTNANGSYFAKININTLALSFDTVPFNFETDMMLGFAIQGATYQWAQRETHGLMPWQSHEENHWTIGSYLHTAAVATAGTYAVLTGPTATDAANTPGIDTLDIHDEDLETYNAAWIQGTYTTAHRLGVGGAWTISTVATSPFNVGASTFVKYNLNTSGTWSLADVPEDNYVNILVLAIPVTSDADSQNYRFLWVTGQSVYTTLTAAQAATALNFDFGSFITGLPEMVPVLMFTYQKASSGGNATPAGVKGRCFLAAEPTKIIGSSRNQIGISGLAPSDHSALSNRTAIDSHPIGAITPLTAGKVIVGDGTGVGLTEATTTTTEVEVLTTNVAKAYTVLNFDATGAPRYDGTDAHILAKGTTAQRPTGSDGMIRYNSDIAAIEAYTTPAAGWVMVGKRWVAGSATGATTIFTPPSGGGGLPTCVGFALLMVMKDGTNSEELRIQAAKDDTVWSGSITSVGGRDLKATITITDATGAVVLTPVSGTWTYKYGVEGFIF